MSVPEAGGSGREELNIASPFHCCSVNRECHVKENSVGKKIVGLFFSLLQCKICVL